MTYANDISTANQPIGNQGGSSAGVGHLPLRDFATSEIARRTYLILFASIIFTLVILSFKPFSITSEQLQPSGGDVVNQIGFLSLLVICLAVVMTQVSTRMLRTVASPVWLIAFMAIGLSVIISDNCASSFRAVTLALISAFVALSIIVVPASLRDFRIVLMLSSISILVISYAGIFLLPDAAIHTSGGFEGQHAGLWRGPFQHKNIAGPIFSILTIIGIYIFRSGNKMIGVGIALMSFYFVLNTGSKTTTGFLPLAIFVVLTARLFGSPKTAIWLATFAVVIASLLTVGAVYSDILRGITNTFLDDYTFTGRDDLWHFGIDNVLARPIFGFGFDNFWQKDIVINGVVPAYSKWDFRDIVHGHNNYIDTLIAFGFVGGSIILFATFVYPMINYVRVYKDPSKRSLADMFMMIIAFTMLLSLMEVFILSRSDPIWILHIFAVLGLQVLAGMRIGVR